jgi:hypothetical protein
MNLGSLSIFRNSLQIREFARGYIAAMPLQNKYQDEYDEWHAFSDDIDINFYVIDGYIRATAYKVIDSMIDTDQEELIYEEKLLLKQLIKKETYK